MQPSNANEQENFPAVGHQYYVDFGGGNAFELSFLSDHEMRFTWREGPKKGQKETVCFTRQKLREGLYLVYWQEKDKTTVVHVEDFQNGIIYTNFTTPEGTFYNASAPLTIIH